LGRCERENEAERATQDFQDDKINNKPFFCHRVAQIFAPSTLAFHQPRYGDHILPKELSESGLSSQF
jgi:hypothetical protein